MSKLFKSQPRQSERGATLVENAIVLPLLIVLVVTAVDMLRLAYLAVTLQFVAEAAIRDIAITNPTSAESRALLKQGAQVYGLTIPDEAIELCPLELPLQSNSAAPCTDFSVGDPGDMLVLRVSLPFQGWILRDYSVGRFTVDLSSLVMAKREQV